jgi:hypothetical protein
MAEVSTERRERGVAAGRAAEEDAPAIRYLVFVNGDG